MNELSNSLTILVLVCIAIGAIVSIVTLTLLYSGLPFFGPVNDLTNAIVGVFIGLLAWQFFAMLPNRSVPGVVGLVFSWIGATLIIKLPYVCRQIAVKIGDPVPFAIHVKGRTISFLMA